MDLHRGQPEGVGRFRTSRRIRALSNCCAILQLLATGHSPLLATRLFPKAQVKVVEYCSHCVNGQHGLSLVKKLIVRMAYVSFQPLEHS